MSNIDNTSPTICLLKTVTGMTHIETVLVLGGETHQ